MIAGLVRAEGWARTLIPALLTCLLLTLQTLPWPGGAEPVMPAFALMGVVYISARLPSCCPPLFALCLGCMADLLELTPLGAQGLAFLTVSLWIRSRQRRFTEQNFIQLWASFALIVFLEMLFLWLAEALATGTILPPGRLAMGGLASVVVFPLIVRVLLVPAERLAREARHV